MRKILIADDEFLVRLGLKTTINWQQYGYSIVGEASNGEEALQMFLNFEPDILMTDIKMPGMDGLELIAKVKQKNKKVQIVILSNYRDFDYARQAMKFGVSQYLIKSEINEKSLLELLKSLSLSDEKRPDAFPDSNGDQNEYLASQASNLHNGVNLSPGLFTAPKRELFPEKAYVILSCTCDVSQLAAHTVDILTDMLNSLIDLHFHQAFHCVSQLHCKIAASIIAPVSHIKTNVADCITSQCKMLSKNIKQYSNVDLIIGMSLPGSSRRFPDMFVEAELARQSCFFLSDYISVFSNQALFNDSLPPKVSFITLKDFIDSGNQSGMQRYIAGIFSQLRDLKNYKFVKSCFIDFLAIAKNLFERLNAKKDTFSAARFDYENFDVMPSIRVVEKHICNLYSEIFDLSQNKSSGYSYFIKTCLTYIADHFSSNITLNDAAKAANISSSYLSLLFKQETGINFSDYLTQYRMKQAEKLLVETNLRIYEIAEKVGFSSPYYFSRVFKDATKMTCKEYKDRYAKT